MSYEFGPNGNYVYTYDNLQWDPSIPRSASVSLTAGPSANQGATPSYFNSEADALAVEWSYINDNSVSVVQFTDIGAFNDGTGWAAYAVIEIFDSVTPTQSGSVSIQALNPHATNPATGLSAYVNFTLQINEEGTPAYTAASQIEYQIWNPGSGIPNAVFATTNASDFNETDTRTYPTVMDGVVEMLYGGLIGGCTPSYTPGSGDNVTSFTINGINYPNTATNFWQYRVYRRAGSAFSEVSMSLVVGPDAFKLMPGDRVVWNYN
jgi:hypothetical protein